MAAMVGPTTALHYEWETRALQIQNNGRGPDDGGTGWQWWVTNLSSLIEPQSNTFIGEPQATRAALAQGFLQSWLAAVSQFTPQQFYTGGYATAAQIPTPGINSIFDGKFIDTMFYTIPQLRYLGVNQTLINQVAAWAQTVWPLGNWAATTTATCGPVGNAGWIGCSTE
jgi:hypothetical protein